MLIDKEAEDIRRGLAAGMRGPVLLKWCELLLADRDERRAELIGRRAGIDPASGAPIKLLYSYATGPGASGAPVFDANTGELLCMHQRSSSR